MAVNLLAPAFQVAVPGATVIPPLMWRPEPAFRDSVVTAPRHRDGVVIHYPGVARSSSIHDAAEHARKIQWNYRNDPERLYDIGYNFVVDQSGRIAVGRGLYRSASQGTTTGNERYLGIQVAVDHDDGLTEFQVLSVQRLIHVLRTRHGYGNAIRGHKDIKPTTCPGKQIYDWMLAGGFEPKPETWPENRFNPWAGRYGPLPTAAKPTLTGGEGPDNYVVSYLQGVLINEFGQVITDPNGTYAWSTVGAVLNMKRWYNATKPPGAPAMDPSTGNVGPLEWSYVDFAALGG